MLLNVLIEDSTQSSRVTVDTAVVMCTSPDHVKPTVAASGAIIAPLAVAVSAGVASIHWVPLRFVTPCSRRTFLESWEDAAYREGYREVEPSPSRPSLTNLTLGHSRSNGVIYNSAFDTSTLATTLFRPEFSTWRFKDHIGVAAGREGNSHSSPQEPSDSGGPPNTIPPLDRALPVHTPFPTYRNAVPPPPQPPWRSLAIRKTMYITNYVPMEASSLSIQLVLGHPLGLGHDASHVLGNPLCTPIAPSDGLGSSSPLRHSRC
ncbi:hypothetical protein K474DRAFT_1678187 [Panus rudis PR-1116 ss-1]|nr:hypothetical protein K474DRAFT_1678187 [Panus rudis PR-1116 ss-1]